MNDISYIYVIGPENEDIVKIGFSKHPQKRLKQLQTGHAVKLMLYYEFSINNAHVREMEKILHQTLQHLCSSGEWFKISAKDAESEIQFAVIKHGETPTKPKYK